MAEMQQIETAVGDDQFFPSAPHCGAPISQPVPSDDFAAKIHAAIVMEGRPDWQRL
jgi:hypothetical protein